MVGSPVSRLVLWMFGLGGDFLGVLLGLPWFVAASLKCRYLTPHSKIALSNQLFRDRQLPCYAPHPPSPHADGGMGVNYLSYFLLVIDCFARIVRPLMTVGRCMLPGSGRGQQCDGDVHPGRGMSVSRVCHGACFRRERFQGSCAYHGASGAVSVRAGRRN